MGLGRYHRGMFSYRHGFHAGNHADVLKHMVLIAVLKHLTAKPTAITVVDTHAGAGLYRLDSDFAGTSGEAQDGILKLVGSPLAADVRTPSPRTPTRRCLTWEDPVRHPSAGFPESGRSALQGEDARPVRPAVVGAVARVGGLALVEELQPGGVDFELFIDAGSQQLAVTDGRRPCSSGGLSRRRPR